MKTVYNQQIGDFVHRIVDVGREGFRGVLIGDGRVKFESEGDDLDLLKNRLLNEAGKLHPDYFGISGAINRFTTLFEGGFGDAQFVKRERKYKCEVAAELEAALALDDALTADEAAARRVRTAYASNLLSSFESARMHEMLGSGDGPAFVRGAARFATGAIDAGLKEMVDAITPHGRPSWPMVTCLPYLWQPKSHMFLKPNVTCDFARRVGHRFAEDYRPEIAPETYASLLALVDWTGRETEMLGWRDNIDLQSFIWVVGAYDENDAAELAEERTKAS